MNLPDFELERINRYLRVSLITRGLAVIGVIAAVQFPPLQPTDTVAFYAIAGVASVANLTYLALGYKRWPAGAFHLSGLLDTIIIGALVAITGGVGSPFVMLLSLVLVFNGVFYGWNGAITAGVPGVIALMAAGYAAPPIDLPLLFAKLGVWAGLGLFAAWVGEQERRSRELSQESARRNALQAGQIRALYETSARIDTQIEAEALLTAAAANTHKLVEAMWGEVTSGISLFSENGTVKIVRLHGDSRARTPSDSFPIESIPDWVMEELRRGHATFLSSNDLQSLAKDFDLPPNATSVAAPIQINENLAGSLWVRSDKGVAPTAEETEIIQTIANHVGSALSRVQLLEKERQERERAVALFELARDLNAFQGVGQVIQETVAAGRIMANVDSCGLALLTPDRTAIDSSSWTIVGAPEDSERALEKLGPLRIPEIAEALQENRPVEVTDHSSASPEARQVSQLVGAEACLLFPIVTHGRGEGVLCLGLRSKRGFTLTQYQLGEAIAGLVAVAIDNARHHEEDKESVEALREMDRRKSEAVSTASHELRSPLTSIAGYASTLLRTGTDFSEEERKEFLKVIESQAKQLARLIDELLTVAPADELPDPIVLIRADLPSIVKECISAAKMRTSAHTFSASISDDLAPIMVEEGKLEQILTNLLDNAIKYSPDGGTISIGAEMADREVHIWVSDEGVGISSTELPRIFERYYQVEGRPTSTGVGLGLSIVQELVEAHDGRIWVESEPGSGTKFHIALPQRRATDLGARGVAAPHPR